MQLFYRFIRQVARFVVFVLNGNSRYQHKERIPTEGSYILVGPHRTWFDPIYFALAGSPKCFSFMAKEELFKNPLLRWIMLHANAFPVNRENPGPSVIKKPVKILKEGELSLIMFPSGTRHSSELKGGAATIAKLSGVPLVPAVFQGPLTIKGLLSRKSVTVNFGEPIYIDRKMKLDKESLKLIEDQMQRAFDQLDQEIDPTFKYEPKK